MSIDALINGLGFLVFAYYLYMIESPDNSLDLKNITKFSILTILLAFCKVPYLAFIFLLLFVPKEKFKTPYYYNIIFFASVTVISILGHNTMPFQITAIHLEMAFLWQTM